MEDRRKHRGVEIGDEEALDELLTLAETGAAPAAPPAQPPALSPPEALAQPLTRPRERLEDLVIFYVERDDGPKIAAALRRAIDGTLVVLTKREDVFRSLGRAFKGRGVARVPDFQAEDGTFKAVLIPPSDNYDENYVAFLVRLACEDALGEDVYEAEPEIWRSMVPQS